MSVSIDFLRPVSPPLAGWLLLAAGIIALVTAMTVDRSYLQAIAEQEAVSQSRVDDARRRARPAVAAAPTATELRQRQAIADVHKPWLATLRAIETTTQDPVFLRSFVVEPATGTIKLEAEAPTFTEALAYAKSLDDTELLRPALLSGHEQVLNPATGKTTVRFQVASRWNTR